MRFYQKSINMSVRPSVHLSTCLFCLVVEQIWIKLGWWFLKTLQPAALNSFLIPAFLSFALLLFWNSAGSVTPVTNSSIPVFAFLFFPAKLRLNSFAITLLWCSSPSTLFFDQRNIFLFVSDPVKVHRRQKLLNATRWGRIDTFRNSLSVLYQKSHILDVDLFHPNRMSLTKGFSHYWRYCLQGEDILEMTEFYFLHLI